MAKPKRKLADIRSEKATLTRTLQDRFSYLIDLTKKTVHRVVKSGSNNDAIDFKDLCAEAAQMIIPKNLGTAKNIQARIDKVNGIISRIEALCCTAPTT